MLDLANNRKKLQSCMTTRMKKNSWAIHGIPEEAYETTEQVVLKLANALYVPVNPQDIEYPRS